MIAEYFNKINEWTESFVFYIRQQESTCSERERLYEETLLKMASCILLSLSDWAYPFDSVEKAIQKKAEQAFSIINNFNFGEEKQKFFCNKYVNRYATLKEKDEDGGLDIIEFEIYSLIDMLNALEYDKESFGRAKFQALYDLKKYWKEFLKTK